MESPEKPRSPSPKRSDRSLSPTLDDKEKQTYIRFLVSNMEAGCIIGKGGSTISEFQSLSGARMQLSRNHELFPGTSERIIMVSGTIDGVMRAIELVLDRLANEAHMQAEETDGEEIISKVTLIIPNSSCGGIIGKGGATIKSFIEDSHAGIKISPQDKNYFGLNDRLVTLTGSIEDCKHALSLIMTKLMEDARYSLSAISPYSYAGFSFSGAHGFPIGYDNPSAAYTTMNYMPNGPGGKYRGNKGMMSPALSTRPSARASEARGISVTIGVADEHIGAVVGRGGRKIMEIMQASGARIKISDRSDFLPGTSDRKVTITGSREAIRIAEDVIMDKIELIRDS